MIEFRHSTDTQAVYDDIYIGEAIHQMDSLFLWLCKILAIKQGDRLLDIATGRGQMVELSQKLGADVYGFDFSMSACQIASRSCPGKIFSADAQVLPFNDNQFDVVTNVGSLEHFENMASGVREMARVLKSNGKACLMVPNSFGLRWNVMTAWKSGDVSDDGQPLQRYGTRKQWQSLLEENGLKVLKVLGYEHERAFPRTRHDWIQYLKSPARLFSMLMIAPLIPVNAASQFVFLCTTKKR